MTNNIEVKQRLEQRKLELEERIGKISDDVRHVDRPVEADSAEAVVDHENDEVIDALGNAAVDELTAVNRALQRLEAGDYGVCDSCGKAISAARLEVLPDAQKCVECAD
ncbi:MAG: TraR/DksA family transcriptional regulator [Gammaproteobacteria bacterium]|nr:MAG: TraR/DksA family transcriptional regulator [Gammaproteobacteria bacterium]